MTHSLSIGAFQAPRTLALLPLSLSLLAGVSATQTAVHVSTSSDASVGTLTLDDATLIASDGGGLPGGVEAFFAEGHWLGTAGFVPTDLDGFGRVPTAAAGSAGSFAFSLLSNEGGFLDGDVLTFASGGGLEVLVSEAELLTALGLPAANIDLDALDFDAQGCLYFSLQSDLLGTSQGDLKDGDVLCYEPALQKLSMRRTEDEVQLDFTLATGITSSVGDVQAIELVAGELWVVTQSPSSHDGAVLACGGSPAIVVDEVGLGLGGAEIDALSLSQPADQLAVLQFDVTAALPGDSVVLTLRGRPNTVYVALMAGGTGWIDFGFRPGFGAWYVDPLDPWLGTIVSMFGPPYGMTDASGTYTTSWTVPFGTHGLGFGGEEGWSFQVMELPTLETSAPFRIEKL